MRVAALIDMGGCIQPAIRLMDYADTQLPEPDQLLTIRDRRRHPKWKKTELRVFDDSPQQREQAGLTLVGSVPEPQFPEVPDPKAACAWAEVVTYLETRDQLIDR